MRNFNDVASVPNSSLLNSCQLFSKSEKVYTLEILSIFSTSADLTDFGTNCGTGGQLSK